MGHEAHNMYHSFYIQWALFSAVMQLKVRVLTTSCSRLGQAFFFLAIWNRVESSLPLEGAVNIYTASEGALETIELCNPNMTPGTSLKLYLTCLGIL